MLRPHGLTSSLSWTASRTFTAIRRNATNSVECVQSKQVYVHYGLFECNQIATLVVECGLECVCSCVWHICVMNAVCQRGSSSAHAGRSCTVSTHTFVTSVAVCEAPAWSFQISHRKLDMWQMHKSENIAHYAVSKKFTWDTQESTTTYYIRIMQLMVYIVVYWLLRIFHTLHCIVRWIDFQMSYEGQRNLFFEEIMIVGTKHMNMK